MADEELYRAHVRFEVNETEAVAQAKETVDAIIRQYDRIRNMPPPEIKIKHPPARSTQMALNGIEAAYDKAMKRIDKKGKVKINPILDLRDELTGKAKKARELLEGIGRSKHPVLMEMKGNIIQELRRVNADLRALDRLHPVPTVTLRDRASAAIRKIRNDLSSLGRAAVSTSISIGAGAANSAMQAAPKMLAGASLVGAAGTVAPLKLAADAENTRLAMDFFGGSSSRGQDAYNRIIQFAAETPYGVDFSKRTATGLMGTYKGMQMDEGAEFNYEAMMADTMRTMTAFGDAAGLTGAGENGANLALLGFRQIGAIGKLNLEELRQVTENLLIPMSQIRKELGLTKEEMADIGNLQIPANRAMEAIVSALEKNYGGGMKRLSETTGGMFQQIADAGRMIFTAFGEGMSWRVKKVFEDLLGEMDYTSDGFQNFLNNVKLVGREVGLVIEDMYFKGKDYLAKVFESEDVKNMDLFEKIGFIFSDLLMRVDGWMYENFVPKAVEWGVAIGKGIVQGMLTGTQELGDRPNGGGMLQPFTDPLYYLREIRDNMNGSKDVGNGDGNPTTSRGGFGSVPKKANGDILTRAQTVIAGEDGPEAIIPLSLNRRERALSLYRRVGDMIGSSRYDTSQTAARGSYNTSTDAPSFSASTGGGVGGVTVNVSVSHNGDIESMAAEVGAQVTSKIIDALQNTPA